MILQQLLNDSEKCTFEKIAQIFKINTFRLKQSAKIYIIKLFLLISTKENLNIHCKNNFIS